MFSQMEMRVAYGAKWLKCVGGYATGIGAVAMGFTILAEPIPPVPTIVVLYAWSLYPIIGMHSIADGEPFGGSINIILR